MPKPPPTPEQVLALLEESPPRIAAAVDGATAVELGTSPGEGEWSAVEVLGHLRACADVWGSCIETILREEAPTIRAVNPRTWIDKTDYLSLDFATSFRAFTAQRHELLALLRGLAPGSWQRTATVTGAGKPLERTVFSYATWLATHERPHVKQIERAVHSVRA